MMHMHRARAAFYQYDERAFLRRVVQRADPQHQAALRKLLRDVSVVAHHGAHQEGAEARAYHAPANRRGNRRRQRATCGDDGEGARETADLKRNRYSRRLPFARESVETKAACGARPASAASVAER
jgi:hypothetical protein